jgi:hypothetical protein
LQDALRGRENGVKNLTERGSKPVKEIVNA